MKGLSMGPCSRAFALCRWQTRGRCSSRGWRGLGARRRAHPWTRKGSVYWMQSRGWRRRLGCGQATMSLRVCTPGQSTLAGWLDAAQGNRGRRNCQAHCRARLAGPSGKRACVLPVRLCWRGDLLQGACTPWAGICRGGRWQAWRF